MNILAPVVAISPLRQRLIDEMEMRRFGRETQRNYIRDVGRFATFLRRSPDTATAEEVRRFQVEQLDQGVSVPTMTPRSRRSARGSRHGSGESRIGIRFMVVEIDVWLLPLPSLRNKAVKPKFLRASSDFAAAPQGRENALPVRRSDTSTKLRCNAQAC